ncbi:SpoIID/LytB domain-containing protein [Dendrosporobacter sp. 1207_IL3150]|uniref:SpoIID/LytB domain-containing protein n=1 Tax=Dendrosporobacter sp. 1207_IL3150 TaxID=3084054 RepID=UPI002FDAE9A1
MTNKYAVCIILLLGLIISLPHSVYASSKVDKAVLTTNQPTIKVGLWSKQSSVLISMESDFALVDTETKEVVNKFTGKEKVIVSYRNGQLLVNGKDIKAKSISVSAKQANTDCFIDVNKKSYRGDIEIRRTASGLTVINKLPIEQYLYGIVPEEMPSEWPLEAIKAQAVAARTFALYSLNKHSEYGFDVCASTDCQVYGGRSSETDKATKAVNATAGMIAAYGGKPIPAFFHSSSGGFTENSENVWGTFFPFLRAVEDYDQKSPSYKWEKQFTAVEISEALRKAGYNIGAIQAIELSPLTKASDTNNDRGVSGRVKTIKFIGTNGIASLNGNKLRTMLSLKSTLFDIKILAPVDKSIDVRITDSAGDRETKKIEINLPPRQERGLITDKENIHRLTGRTGEMISITGSGWGHGLGMSQWGAKAMAEKGPAGDATYFKEILKHYYQSIDIKKAY